MAAMTSVGRAAGLDPLEFGFDSRAEEALYRRNAGRVFGFCVSRLGRREDAEDAVQTTFLHAVRSLRRGVVPLVESAWLLGIARNVCLKRWETAGRRSRLESTCDPQELDQGSAAPEGRREELIGLEDALTRLPEQQRRAILLRDWRGLSYDEVAEQLGVSRAAVETLIFRGRRTLAQNLGEEPQQTKRRLASLGNLGSLFAALKTAFTGAAAATKVAAAVTVVAVSGAGLAVGPQLAGGAAEKPRRVEPQQPRIPAAPANAAAIPTRSAPVPAARKPAATSPEAARRATPVVLQQAPAAARPAGTAASQSVPATESGIRPAPGPAGIVPAVPAPPPAAKESTPVERTVHRVRDSATSLPLPDGLGPPVTPAAVGAIVEIPALPVDPIAVVPGTPVAVPPLPPLWP